MPHYVYISIETSGLEVKEERVVEIAALKINSKTKLRTLFHQYFNPQKEINASVSGIINLTNSFLKECPIISEKIDSFLEFINNCDLIMRNKPFIMKFLNKELNLVKKILTSNKEIDAHDLARVRFPNEINSLDFLFRALNLEKDIIKTCLHEVILLPLLVEKIQDHETHEIN
jgi:DNA polymerase III alpha subunit (gram-positive type)